MRCMVLAPAVLAGFCGGAAAAPVSFAPDASGAITFVMPSGNIACIYTPAGGSTVYTPADGGPELACDRAEPTYLRFTLAASGPAEVRGDIADPGCCGGSNTFAYGTSWALPPFQCTATSAGLDCRRGANGFFIAKAKISAYQGPVRACPERGHVLPPAAETCDEQPRGWHIACMGYAE